MQALFLLAGFGLTMSVVLVLGLFSETSGIGRALLAMSSVMVEKPPSPTLHKAMYQAWSWANSSTSTPSSNSFTKVSISSLMPSSLRVRRTFRREVWKY